MELFGRISLEQQQKLLITPELRQAIEVLQMSTLELVTHIKNTLEENPFLDEKEEEILQVDREGLDEPVKSADSQDDDWHEYCLEYFNDRDIGQYNGDIEVPEFDRYLFRPPGLREHLDFQLHISYASCQEMQIGTYIIDSLDPAGYLSASLEEIAEANESSTDEVARVLALIQTFHPHGVGARSMEECLIIQMKHSGHCCDAAIKIVEHHLADVASGNLKRIARCVNLPVFEVQQLCDLLKRLDPKPGLHYHNAGDVNYIIPDVAVEKMDNEYHVIINDNSLPSLGINKIYGSMLKNRREVSKETREYLRDKMNSALGLMRAIEQRNATIYKVSRCIVDMQTDFLDNGVRFLKPLTLKQVAQEVGVHESTVSRVTSNKYMQTPQGLFAMRYFFDNALASEARGGCTSAKAIRSIIGEIVKNEDSGKPLSDQKIVDSLQARGIHISRRTVAKYRQEMGMASAGTRRRYQKDS